MATTCICCKHTCCCGTIHKNNSNELINCPIGCWKSPLRLPCKASIICPTSQKNKKPWYWEGVLAYIYIYIQQHPLPLPGIHAVRLFANDMSHFAGGDHVRREAEADLGGARRSPGEADGGLSGALERPKSWPKQVPFPELGSPEKEE